MAHSTPNLPHFTPIQESEEGNKTPKHHPTPLHEPGSARLVKSGAARRRPGCEEDVDGSVSWYKCRPHARERISVVPLDNNKMSMASPNKIFKSIISTLTRKSPRPSESSTPSRDQEQWKIAVAELSHKLVHATRKRDEALLEASRLKYSMAELEKKLTKLELYCHSLKSSLDECSNNNNNGMCVLRLTDAKEKHNYSIPDGVQEQVIIDRFLVSVSEARSAVRLLSRSLTMQLRHMGVKVYERISTLLQPYDVRINFNSNPKGGLFYLEALLNRALFEDFESVEFRRSSSSSILNPSDRCEANYASHNILQGLTWEEVLNKGTRHFSEELSRFCDQKMSEIVGMLGWNRAWPEPLLQAFFSASKSVWLVHLLATSVHPGLSIFRVDKGVRFDPVYMEDMGGDKAGVLVPSTVRIMVAPGFYVYGNVVKCKVLCRYHNGNNNSNNAVHNNHIHDNNPASP